MTLETYEINGVITYAHCYCITVKAGCKLEARKLAEEKIDEYIDPASAEYQEYIMDEPIKL